MNAFSDLGLLPSLVRTLTENKLIRPTEIQAMAIPMLMGGQSVVGISETGSGKTLAYALPLLHILKDLEHQDKAVNNPSAPRAIVVVPTRELGDQVSKDFKKLTHETRVRIRPALGGMEFEQIRRNVGGVFEILIATPGRLIQLLDRELIDLSDVRLLVFDEADQMLDQGFVADSKTIVDACTAEPQLGLFSATVSKSVEELMGSLFAKAEFFRSQGSGKIVKTLVTENVKVVDGKRWPVFEKILKKPVTGGTLVFANTREQCDSIVKGLTEKNFPCAAYRGEMDKNERRQNLKKFREGKIKILVSTDLASRGLDVDNIGRVVNFHLPKQMENYIHRVGRTARAGRPGLVINLVTERDASLMNQVSPPSSKRRSVSKPKSNRTRFR